MMTLFLRLIGVGTFLLALATMAVSAYAAKYEPGSPVAEEGPAVEAPTFESGDVTALWAPYIEAAAPSEDGDAPAAGAPLGRDSRDSPEPTAGAVDGASSRATPPPPKYAAPVGAAPATRGFGGRGDLSVGPRVGPVLSIRPVIGGLGLLGAGGLDIPKDQLVVMQQVSFYTGIPWQILAGIAKVESAFGQNMATSSAGAIGYGQFLPEVWEQYGEGGNPYDFRDALPAMARYLLVAGAPEDIPSAVFAYNHSWPYVALVLSHASSYGYELTGDSGALIWPSSGPISTFFEPGHPAIDIDQTMRPGAPVLTAHDGVVIFAGGDPCCGYGYYVVVVGSSGISTLYAHLQAIMVIPGETVRQAQPLGVVGCTGRCTGTHLHFEVIENGTRRNPLEFLP